MEELQIIALSLWLCEHNWMEERSKQMQREGPKSHRSVQGIVKEKVPANWWKLVKVTREQNRPFTKEACRSTKKLVQPLIHSG